MTIVGILTFRRFSAIDILVKNELCKLLERGSNVISTGKGSFCLSPHSKLKIAVRFCSIYKRSISFNTLVMGGHQRNYREIAST